MAVLETQQFSLGRPKKIVDNSKRLCYPLVVPNKTGREKEVNGMRSNLLRAKMAEMGENQRSLAKKIHISENSLRSKLYGRTEFSAKEIVDICNALSITDCEDKANIFLS